MRLVDWLTIAAIVLGPIIAIRISTFLERRKENKRRKEYVFRTLMATRASRLSVEHVQALNMIDIEYYESKRLRRNSKNKAVVDAWKEYLDLLSNNQLKEKSPDVWFAKFDDLFIEVMHRMAIALGYDFDKTAIKNTSYMPVAHGTIEDETNIIRQGFASIFRGEAALPMQLIRPEQTPEELEQQKKEQERQAKMNQLQERYLSGQIPTKVIIVNDETGLLLAQEPQKLLTEETIESSES